MDDNLLAIKAKMKNNKDCSETDSYKIVFKKE